MVSTRYLKNDMTEKDEILYVDRPYIKEAPYRFERDRMVGGACVSKKRKMVPAQ